MNLNWIIQVWYISLEILLKLFLQLPIYVPTFDRLSNLVFVRRFKFERVNPSMALVAYKWDISVWLRGQILPCQSFITNSFIRLEDNFALNPQLFPLKI